MCTIKSPNLLCTYVHIKPKLILFNTVAPPASCTNINSLSTKPMFQTFHLEPINDVLCKELGLWGDWNGLLHLPTYCAHMCTIIFGRGLERERDRYCTLPISYYLCIRVLTSATCVAGRYGCWTG